MTTFELNIGLFVGNEHADDAINYALANTWGEIMHRESTLRSVLRGQLSCMCRFHAGEEPTLVVRGTLGGNAVDFHTWLHELSCRFGQDCIALYYPDKDVGYLIGPRAAAWGDFQEELFVRY